MKEGLPVRQTGEQRLQPETLNVLSGVEIPFGNNPANELVGRGRKGFLTLVPTLLRGNRPE